MENEMEPFVFLNDLEGKVGEASHLIQRLRKTNENLEEEVKRLKEENGNLKNRQNLLKEKIHLLLQQIPIDKSSAMK